MIVRQTRYQKGRGIGSFLRRVATKTIKKLKSPTVKKLIKKALKSSIVKSAVSLGAEKVVESIANSKPIEKIITNSTIKKVINDPSIQQVVAEVIKTKPIQKKVKVLNDINTLLTKPKHKRIKPKFQKTKKHLKGWRKISGNGIILD